MEQPSGPELDQLLQEVPLLPPFAPFPQLGGYPNTSPSSWGMGEPRWDDSIRPGHA